jgi:hypothetical protein
MKCPRCPKPTNRILLLAFRNGQPIYACTKHAGTTPHDPITDWISLPKVRRVIDEQK